MQDFRGQPSSHYRESRMLLRDSFWACHHASRDHVSQALVDLHWLPVRYRILYKLVLMIWSIPARPSHIKDSVTPISQDQTRRRLRSADTTDYVVPRTRTKFGEGAFRVAGPSTWNSLPESLRRTDCTGTFKRRPITHFLTSTSALFCIIFFTVLLTLIMPGRSASL